MPAAAVTPRAQTLVAGAAVLALGAIAIVVAAAIGGDRALPVVATLGGADAEATPIATLRPALALGALLVGGAATLALAAAARSERARAIVLAAGWSQGAGIVVVLVARANGIAEVAAIVPLFALAASSVALQAIDQGPPTPTWRRPGAWAAASGIVPWGVIAFAQIGATLIGDGPSLGIRIATLLGLGVAVAGWTALWRRRAGTVVVLAMMIGLGVTGFLLLASL